MSEDQSDIPQLKTIEDPVITLPNVIPLVSHPIVNVVTSLSGTKGPESGVVTSSPSPKETKDNQINPIKNNSRRVKWARNSTILWKHQYVFCLC